ncbi:transglycosylase SLT domain-containing protein [Hasllibacter halocynthiae]|nr:transglycosylase SLT domain-containing protein [Hasllibacter halocynthiae]
MIRTLGLAAALAAGFALSACSEAVQAPFNFAGLSPVEEPEAVPAQPILRWSHRSEGPEWTLATMNALASHGEALPDMVPADIESWCPAYPQASEFERRAFWAGLISALAWHESTHRPAAVGGGGRWHGLVQILPSTARGYGCEARSGIALQDGPANLRCAVRIMSSTVARDGVISRGMRGVAADWGPFHSARKREDMRRWVSSQPFCAQSGDMTQLASAE